MEKTKILVVDDHRENIIAMSELIADDDIDIYSAENAEQALNHILEHEFALALLDVQMPGVSGFELARLIRGVNRTRNLPVIFVTAEQRDQSIIFEGYETGAVDLMFKPLDPYIVRSKVQAFVQLDHQARLLREQMNEVESLRKRAEDANLAKSQFLANMSHEIRTPLASVLGFSDVLSQETLSEEEKDDCLAAIRRNGELLLRLIDDILDLSKIEAQQLQFLKTEFSLDEVLNDINSTLNYRCEQKGITLEISRGFPQASRYFSDPIRIKQILLNIIGNAVKFTSKGKVQVDVTAETLSKNTTKLRFRVKDSGIGISEAEQANLFQPFSQADISTRRRFGGTGLGLVIARHLARSLSGDLVLSESTPGVGSVFEISLVVAEVPTNKIALPTLTVKSDVVFEQNFLQGIKLLVVDDVSDNRILIDRYLKKSGAEIIEASSGTEALRLIEEKHPDLVLMDIQMPVMDGYEATARAREQHFVGPIIALTAHAMKEEIQKCLNAGCNEVMTKPARRQDLLELLKRMTEGMRKAH